MKTVGYLLFIGGALMATTAFFLPTAVDSSSGISASGGTLNLGLLQNQMMILHVGLAAFLGGSVLIGCAAVAERVEAAFDNDDEDDEPLDRQDFGAVP
jgi:hypothetical protein